jgi:hypothetical protein
MRLKNVRSFLMPGAAVLIVAALLLLAFAAFAGTDGAPGTAVDPLVTQSYVDGLTQWQVIDLKAGQTLTGHAGSEFIVRRGSVRLVDQTGNGVPDLTVGVDISAGERVALNHHLLFPRKDGRGVQAVDSAVVMVRGGAELK